MSGGMPAWDSARGGPVLFAAGRGAALGVVAGVVQVVVAQLVGLATGRRERTDIAPRLVQRAAERLGTSPSRPLRWLLATVFHFGYGAGWGGLFALARRSRRARRIPTGLAGCLLGVAIYGAAFSRAGAGTRLGSERHPERRRWYEFAIQWASSLAFALVVAYAEAWTRPEQSRAVRSGDDDGRASL